MKRIALGGLALLLVSCSGADNQVEAPLGPAAGWAERAARDGDFALRLITENHPGVLPQLRDEAFTTRLETARLRYRQRLPHVRDEAGYDALMSGLAADFGDPHIWWKPDSDRTEVGWPGFVVGRRQGAWRVTASENADGQPARGSVLVSCDGVEAEVWASTRIRLFRADLQHEAQLARNGQWLFLDEANPFLTRPEVCVFQAESGAVVSHELVWRDAAMEALKDVFDKSEPKADAGLSVSALGGGYWIGLNSLQGVEALIADVERRKEELRRAEWVVVDLRGNRGGSTEYSSRLFSALVGAEHLSAARRETGCRRSYYRVSSGNIARLRGYRDDIRSRQGEGSAKGMKRFVAELEFADRLGLAIWPLYRRCNAPGEEGAIGSAERRLPPSLMEGRLVIVTDRNCFSSCVLAVQLAKRLQAVQVGESTNMNNRYMEVRTARTPSGKGEFSTLMKVVEGMPDAGPFVPDHPYDGDLADTRRLQHWVAAELLKVEQFVN